VAVGMCGLGGLLLLGGGVWWWRSGWRPGKLSVWPS
jgi:hypothetical protein